MGWVGLRYLALGPVPSLSLCGWLMRPSHISAHFWNDYAMAITHHMADLFSSKFHCPPRTEAGCVLITCIGNGTRLPTHLSRRLPVEEFSRILVGLERRTNSSASIMRDHGTFENSSALVRPPVASAMTPESLPRELTLKCYSRLKFLWLLWGGRKRRGEPRLLLSAALISKVPTFPPPRRSA